MPDSLSKRRLVLAQWEISVKEGGLMLPLFFYFHTFMELLVNNYRKSKGKGFFLLNFEGA